jgi:hypothetical protein
VVLVACLSIAHYAVGWRRDGQRAKPAQAELPPAAPSADPDLSSSAALAGPATPGAPRAAFPGTGCAFAMQSRPEIRTVQPTGMSGGLDSWQPLLDPLDRFTPCATTFRYPSPTGRLKAGPDASHVLAKVAEIEKLLDRARRELGAL